MIRTFGDGLTEDLFHGSRNVRTRRISPLLISSILRKFDMLNSAMTINDLRMPPGNHLESLKGELKDYYSIRVNDQFRIIFIWHEPFADDVKLVDYH